MLPVNLWRCVVLVVTVHVHFSDQTWLLIAASLDLRWWIHNHHHHQYDQNSSGNSCFMRNLSHWSFFRKSFFIKKKFKQKFVNEFWNFVPVSLSLTLKKYLLVSFEDKNLLKVSLLSANPTKRLITI